MVFRIFRNFASVFLLLSLFIRPAFAELSKAEQAKIRDLLITLAGEMVSGSTQEKIAAIQTVDKYPYQEVIDVIHGIIGGELKESAPNGKCLVALVGYLERHGGPDSAARIAGYLETVAKKKKFSEGTVAQVTTAFEAAQAKVKSNPPLTSYRAAGPAAASPNDAGDLITTMNMQLLADYQKAVGQLRAMANNQLGRSIPAISDPNSVVQIVSQFFETSMATYGDKVKHPESGRALRPKQGRALALEALKLLYKGRGRSSDQVRDGWYPANASGATGLPEIQKILSMNLLDSEGLQDFTFFLQNYSFDEPSKKISVGFPPGMTIHTTAQRDQLLQAITKVTPAQPYDVLPGRDGAKTKRLRELIEEKVSDSELQKALLGFVASVEKNLYDESISNLEENEFPDYYGRDEEVTKTVDALTKLKKSHILFTGKAGVGKTTILRLLSDRMIQEKISVRDELPAIFMELPITAVTNPTDPSQIQGLIKSAVTLSRLIDRRIVLFVDEAHISTKMTRNALKAFLTELTKPIPNGAKVHLIFSTTSSESREFFSDTAFSRRWTQIHVREFNHDEAIQLIKQAAIPMWKKFHKKAGLEFDGVSEDAFEYAYRYASVEQPHAGNPTGLEEILEATITRKMNAESGKKTGKFTIDVEDIQQYVFKNLNIDLIPGDPNFETNFDLRWKKLDVEYVGNEGAKAIYKELLRSHFGQIAKDKMSTLVQFGPPGGGKTYGAEKIAEHFFNGALLTINGAEFKSGGLEINKLIGSPTGTVGSEEQRSMLSKFVAENPQGGVIKIEEADYLHQDIIQFLTNAITDRKFTDGLGKEWDLSRFVIIANSNIGQDAMIPSSPTIKMSWPQFHTRRDQLTEKVDVGGKLVERVRDDRLESIFDRFIETIVMNGKDLTDTSQVAQEAQKQRRRWRAAYILPPNQEELLGGAKAKLKKFVDKARLEYGITIELPETELQKIIDLENYQFEKGHSYVQEKLEAKLFSQLYGFFHLRGSTFKIRLEDILVDPPFGEDKIPGQNLVVDIQAKVPADSKVVTIPLGAILRIDRNPWASNKEMMERINTLEDRMAPYIVGNEEVIQDAKDLLKLKSGDWTVRPVMTLIGTTGNGKTEFAKAMAMALYDDPNALHTITGVTHEYQLNDVIGSPAGFVGSNVETQFEKFIKSRMHSGGGVILLDELLSLSGLNDVQLSERLGVLNKLYQMLDEGVVTIRGRSYDVRGFQIIITGNAMQEYFEGIDDSPDAEPIIKKIRQKLDRKAIVDYFAHHRFDAPKIARLGRIHVLGPLKKAQTLQIGRQKVANEIKKILRNQHRQIKIEIDDLAIQKVVERLTTVKLGMREVNKGFEKMIFEPLNHIVLSFPKAKEIRLKLDPATLEPHWYVDQVEVAKEGIAISGSAQALKSEWRLLAEHNAESKNITPTLNDIGEMKKLKYTDELLATVAIHEFYGHWLTGFLLQRDNTTAAISLYAGESHLGYVRFKDDGIARERPLSDALRELIVLNAGHRSVFLHGLYAPGGGNNGAPRDPKNPGNDDLGRVDRMIDSMINNNMLPGVYESSAPQRKAIYKLLIHQLIDEMSDQIISEGVKSEKFASDFEELIRKRYMSEERLDEILKQFDFTSFGGRHEFFLKHWNNAVQELLDRAEGPDDIATTAEEEQAVNAKKKLRKMLITDMSARLYTEGLTRTQTSPDEHQAIERLQKGLEAQGGISVKPANCLEGLWKLQALASKVVR